MPDKTLPNAPPIFDRKNYPPAFKAKCVRQVAATEPVQVLCRVLRVRSASYYSGGR